MGNIQHAQKIVCIILSSIYLPLLSKRHLSHVVGDTVDSVGRHSAAGTVEYRGAGYTEEDVEGSCLRQDMLVQCHHTVEGNMPAGVLGAVACKDNVVVVVGMEALHTVQLLDMHWDAAADDGGHQFLGTVKGSGMMMSLLGMMRLGLHTGFDSMEQGGEGHRQNTAFFYAAVPQIPKFVVHYHSNP